MPKKVRFLSRFTYETKVWLGGESNSRHEDFQSSALPTELPSRSRRMRKRNRAGETIFELQPVTMTDSNRSQAGGDPIPEAAFQIVRYRERDIEIRSIC